MGKYLKFLLFLLALLAAFAAGIYVRHEEPVWLNVRDSLKKIYYWKKTLRGSSWDKKFERVTILSTDSENQKAYFYKSTATEKKPLLVSLHTWSGNYTEYDPLAELAAKKNINYIHPDFMGANNTSEACCSDKVIQALDDAIDYALDNANATPDKIYVTGASGGGYATLCMLMKSKHRIFKFAAWVPITDLEAWYYENIIRKGNFSNDILLCTESKTTVDSLKAAERSPIKWSSASANLKHAEISIYAGVYDGLQGSVPITHSINFYNKLLKDQQVNDASAYISDAEKAFLLEKRMPIKNFGTISSRKIMLHKKHENINILIFEGGHEMLAAYNLKKLLE
jgi:esterase/lipase